MDRPVVQARKTQQSAHGVQQLWIGRWYKLGRHGKVPMAFRNCGEKSQTIKVARERGAKSIVLVYIIF